MIPELLLVMVLPAFRVRPKSPEIPALISIAPAAVRVRMLVEEEVMEEFTIIFPLPPANGILGAVISTLDESNADTIAAADIVDAPTGMKGFPVSGFFTGLLPSIVTS
jgi:hypothetical protein